MVRERDFIIQVVSLQKRMMVISFVFDLNSGDLENFNSWKTSS